MSEITLTDDNFDQEVLKSETPVLVDFWAPWCGPCRMVGPIIEEIAKEYSGKIKVGKITVDDNPKSASSYNIMSIPSMILFKNGKPVKSMVGVQSKESLKKEIDLLL